MLIRLTKQTKFCVRVHSFIKPTNTNAVHKRSVQMKPYIHQSYTYTITSKF
ncbi:hypothetical protein HanIR_Chr08g0346301 [Helianthus annuus]|nr:hypothetical protein HanIR_Chr08g0346301 [Helianthus annuus]